MGYARAIVSLNRDSLLPQDLFVNVFHFEPPGAVSSSGADIVTALDTFYTAIASRLGAALTGTGGVDIYDLEDPSPRVPVYSDAITFGTLGSGCLPTEVALCLSFQGAPASGENQARRRGRIFLGPLDSGVSSGTSEPRPASAARTAITAAADALMGTAGINWSVFSPTTAGAPPWDAGSLDAAFTPVANGWVDDAFDTIRSRGAAPTTRTVFP